MSKVASGFTLVLLFLLGISTIQTSKTALAVITGTNGKIAFASRRDGNLEVYSANSDGTNQINLTNNVSQDYEPEWSPDGTKIAFRTTRDAGNNEIYTMDATGGNLVRITNNSATDEAPTWAPDGQRLAFSSNIDGDKEIYAINSDGTGIVQLTNNSDIDQEPAWSPDGTKIAFVSFRDGNYELYVMNSDGTNQTRITNNSDSDFFPAWSPDGTKIVFATAIPTYFLHTINSDGTNENNISLISGSTQDFDPAWSADGSKILFSSRNTGLTSDNEVYQMDLDGSNRTLLVANPLLDSQPSAQSIPDRDQDSIPDITDVDDDGDGISDAVENSAPNNGDGNNDKLLDSIQPNCVSFTDATSGYISFISTNGTQFKDVYVGGVSSLGSLPGNITPTRGVYQYRLTNIQSGGTIPVTVIFHDGYIPVSIFKYGKEPGQSTSHYYNFTDNGTTGAVLGSSTLTLNIIDGGRGDDDQLANGIIVDPIAFSSSPPGVDTPVQAEQLADTGSSYRNIQYLVGILLLIGAIGTASLVRKR